jgi:transposase
MEGLKMLEITNTAVTRDEVWHAFRRTRDTRLRERYHCILLLLDGKSCPEIAQWLYRDEETLRRWVHAFNTSGLPGLEREASLGRPA